MQKKDKKFSQFEEVKMLCVPLQFLNTLKILSAPLTSSHSIFFLSINAYMAKKKMLMKMLIVVALNRLMKSFK